MKKWTFWLLMCNPIFGFGQSDTSMAIIPLVDTVVAPIENIDEIEQNDKKVKPTKTLTGTASFYAAKFEGRKTANGEIFSHKKLTAACNVLPLGTWIRVTNLSNGKSVIVKTNDRLHPKMNRIVDLTSLAAEKLNFISRGLTKVKVEVLPKNYKK